MIVVADTSALFAAFDQSQPEHDAAREVMLAEHLLLSPMVLAELDHLTHRDLGFPAASSILDSLLARLERGQYRLAEISAPDLSMAQQVRTSYTSLELDLADAVGVVLADRHRTNLLFTLDQRDFRVVRPLGTRYPSFALLPADRLEAGAPQW